jgi:hypothetical protein
MVLGDQVFCLCKLRHFGPDNNCHGPNGRSGSLTQGPVDRKSSQTWSPDGHSGSLNCGRSRPCEGCCPRSSSRRSCDRSRSGSLTRGPVDCKSSQTRSPDGHSGSLTRVPDCHSGSLNCGRSRPREGCCPRSSCRWSCRRSHSESRPTRCRQYQQCQGGKFVTIMCRNDELSSMMS